MRPVIDEPTQTSANRFGASSSDRIGQTLTSSNNTFKASIAAELWAQLSFARLADETGHRGMEHIVRVASTSYEQILDWHLDLKRMSEAICRAAIEIRGDSTSQQFSQTLVQEMQAKALNEFVPPKRPQSFIASKFADLDPNTAMAIAIEQLEQLCMDTVTQLFLMLDQLQAMNLVGSVEHEDASCKFIFHRRVAILAKGSSSTKQTQRFKNPEPTRDFDDHHLDTYQQTDIEVQHRTAWHAHHVHKPNLREVEQVRYPLPAQYRQLIDECPHWLRPHLRILEGDLFREERVEWDQELEKRPDVELVSSRWVRDPAIVLENYVLAGWGEEAITEHETLVRNQQAVVDKVNTLEMAYPYGLAAAFLAITSMMVMLLSIGFASFPLPIIAIVLGLAGLYLASQAIQNALIGQGRWTILREIALTTLAGCGLFCIDALLFALIHQSIIAGVMALFLGGIGAIIFSVNRDILEGDENHVHG